MLVYLNNWIGSQLLNNKKKKFKKMFENILDQTWLGVRCHPEGEFKPLLFSYFSVNCRNIFSQLIFVWYKCLFLIQTCYRAIVDLK